jgi:hypothetical protein
MSFSQPHLLAKRDIMSNTQLIYMSFLINQYILPTHHPEASSASSH